MYFVTLQSVLIKVDKRSFYKRNNRTPIFLGALSPLMYTTIPINIAGLRLT